MVVNFLIFPEGFGVKSAQVLALRATTLRLLISGSLVRAQQAEPISTRSTDGPRREYLLLSGKPSGN
jgi:hypothetical protein